MSAVAMFVMVVVMMLMTTIAVFVMVVVMMLMTTIAMFIMVVVMMLMTTIAMFFMVVMMMLMFYFCQQLCGQICLLFHLLQQFLAVQLLPRRGHNQRMIVVLAQQFYHLLHFFRTCSACTAQQNGIRRFYLIEEKFTKVFQIHLAFVYVHYRNLAGNFDFLTSVFHRLHNIG